MADPFTILAGLGMATQVYGTLQQAQNQAIQARQQSLLQQEELDEFIRRQDVNLDLLERDVQEVQAQTVGTAAARGVGIDSVSVMQQMADTSSRAANAISTLMEETQFKINAGEFEIESLRQSANEIEKAGMLNALSQGLGGSFEISQNAPGTRKKVSKINPERFSLLSDDGQLKFGDR